MTSPPVTETPSATPLAVAPKVAQSHAFFDALLGAAPDDLHSLLWTLQDKRSHWTPVDAGPATVADKAQALADDGKDVYMAVSLAATPGLSDTRIRSANAAGIFGLWADIDIADPDVHAKWNLPPSIEAAQELLAAAECEPTLVVHSGHGLQAWWLFKEFWTFDSEDQRMAAAGLAQRWNTTLQVRAAERQWVVDSTFDLARVMRVPGTVNRKGSPVMPVRLLKADGPRYEAEDIDAYQVDHTLLRGIAPTKAYVPDPFTIDETDQPDFELFQALSDNEERFGPTWDRKRKDLPDQSASSYDLALANMAVRAAWPDKEIGKLIFRFRKRHNLDPAKGRRIDYLHRTITKARDGVAREDSTEVLDDVVEALEDAHRSGDDEQVKDTRRDGLSAVGSQLNLEILHFIKYMSDPPAYAMVTPTRTIDLGGADGILRWDKMKQSVWQSVGHSIPRFKTAEWDRITALIPHLCEEHDVGSEATDRGELDAWLGQYLGQRPPVDTVDEAATSEYPFKVEGRVVMFGPAFKRWLYLTYQERITNKELGKRLRAYGCEPDKVNVEVAGKRSTRGVWRLPAGVS